MRFFALKSARGSQEITSWLHQPSQITISGRPGKIPGVPLRTEHPRGDPITIQVDVPDPAMPDTRVIAHEGQLALAISNVVVRLLASTTGRGPTKAKTTLGDNAVFVVLKDTLTRGERNLVAAGESTAVLTLRRLWQDVMRETCSREIEELTGRKVVGFMSDNHIDPDIAVEVFILEPLQGDSTERSTVREKDPTAT